VEKKIKNCTKKRTENGARNIGNRGRKKKTPTPAQTKAITEQSQQRPVQAPQPRNQSHTTRWGHRQDGLEDDSTLQNPESFDGGRRQGGHRSRVPITAWMAPATFIFEPSEKGKKNGNWKSHSVDKKKQIRKKKANHSSPAAMLGVLFGILVRGINLSTNQDTNSGSNQGTTTNPSSNQGTIREFQVSTSMGLCHSGSNYDRKSIARGVS